MSVLKYNKVFDRKIRNDSFEEMQVTTFQRIKDCIRSKDLDDAIEYIEYFDFQASVDYNLYKDWFPLFDQFADDKGVSESELQGVKDELNLLVNHWIAPDNPYDRESELRKHHMLQARLTRHLNAPVSVAINSLEEWKEHWRTIHDRDVDYVSGLMNYAHLKFGEESIEELYRGYLTGPHFDWRYKRFDVSISDWKDMFENLLYVTLESVQGHLFGPKREGHVDVLDLEDRVEMTFTPCGSGGRTVAGDKIAGTASRHEAPYYYKVMEKKHDFSWNKTGVCHYCVHCSMVLEKMPIEKFGYPVRVVEPPVYPDNPSQCKYIMYKDPRDVPEKYYTRVGEKKPPPDVPLGSVGRKKTSA